MNERETFADLSDVFDFEASQLDYHDGPLAGWLRSRETGEWYPFQCDIVIDRLLWHWTLVPAHHEGDASQVIADAAASPDGVWLSVVEDRRAGAPRCSAARIRNATARPPARAGRDA